MPETAIEFTPREKDILRLAARGLGQKQIAEHLSLRPRTASVHLGSIYEKAGIGGQTAGKATRLTVWAIEHGYGPGGAHA